MTILKLFNGRLELDTENTAKEIYNKHSPTYNFFVKMGTFVIISEKNKYADCDYSYGLRFDSPDTHAKVIEVIQNHREIHNWMVQEKKKAFQWRRGN